MKIKIVNAWADGFFYHAILSDGTTVSQATTCKPYAWDHFCRDCAEATGQTPRGIRQSMRRYFS